MAFGPSGHSQEKPMSTSTLERPSTFTADIEVITPSLAATYLEANIKNRKVKEKAVQRYAADMVAGEWMLTGEAIKFSDEGSLLDGQNRLRAIVMSRTPIPM